jgi:D-Tyr-tRNAtyr deacylase
MRAVIQKVLNASVVVDGVTISSIGKGLMVLVGIGVGTVKGLRPAVIAARRTIDPRTAEQTTHQRTRH